MSELAKEKLYRKELIKAGAKGNNNVSRIRSLAGGGGSALYAHNITFTNTEFGYHLYFQMVILNSTDTQLSYEDVYDYLETNGFVVTTLGRFGEDEDTFMEGTVYTLGTSGCYSNERSNLNCVFIYDGGMCAGELLTIGVVDADSLDHSTVSDTVVQIQ